MVEPSNTGDRHLFLNRELSWLAFNERVLAEARNSALPIHERLKFQAIVSGNLDEFFMVRVAGIKQQIQGGIADLPADGMLPGEQLTAIAERTHRMVDEQYRVWQREIMPLLSSNGMAVLSRDALTTEQKAAARVWFQSNVFPALTPLAVDPGHPFPHLRNKSLNVAVVVRRGGQRRRKEPGRVLSRGGAGAVGAAPRCPCHQRAELRFCCSKNSSCCMRAIFSQGSRWNTRARFDSRETGTSTLTKRNRRTSWLQSNRNCASEIEAPSFDWSSTRPPRRRSNHS